jgi:hypothetical protein
MTGQLSLNINSFLTHVQMVQERYGCQKDTDLDMLRQKDVSNIGTCYRYMLRWCTGTLCEELTSFHIGSKGEVEGMACTYSRVGRCSH